MVFLEDLAKDLMEELNCETVFTIPPKIGICGRNMDYHGSASSCGNHPDKKHED